jgi:hypothetical protein
MMALQPINEADVSLLVDNSHCESKDAKSEMSAVNTAIMFGTVALAAVLLGAGFFQLTKDMHSNISNSIIVNGGKLPPAKQTPTTKINNDVVPNGDGGGDTASGDGGGPTTSTGDGGGPTNDTTTPDSSQGDGGGTTIQPPRPKLPTP